jgi:hypothetical protein
MLGRIIHDTQNVYINGERLRGVQTCETSWAGPTSYINAVGVQGGFVGSTVEESLQASFDVSRLMVTPHDPLVNLFETVDIGGEIAYGPSETFSFNKAFISSYSSSCQIGSVPTLDFGLIAYGESGSNVFKDSREAELDGTIIIAMPGSMVLDVDGYETNRVQSFDFSISVGRKPINVIGKLHPHDFLVEYPIQVDCRYVLHVDDYESSELWEYVCTPKEQNLNLTFRDCSRDQEVRRFFMPAARLIEYSQTGTINEDLEATLTYKTLLSDIKDVEKVVKGIAF